MNDKPCSRIVDLLVDYADGEVNAADRCRVAEHLAECVGCRAELRLLERSLELARAEWREAAARPLSLQDRAGESCPLSLWERVRVRALRVEPPPSPPTPLPKGEGRISAGRLRPRGRRVLAASVAASAVLVLWASIAWFPPRSKSGGQPEVAIAQPEPSPPPAMSKEFLGREVSPPPALSEDEIDAFISRQTRTARLEVAVKLLASQPGLEDYKAKAERYLAEVSASSKHTPSL